MRRLSHQNGHFSPDKTFYSDFGEFYLSWNIDIILFTVYNPCEWVANCFIPSNLIETVEDTIPKS